MIRQVDMRLIDDLFEMGGGYVLDFSDRTFSDFFSEELGVDIDGPDYRLDGSSKGKRLRCFLKRCSPELRIRALLALWEYRQHLQGRKSTPDPVAHAEEAFWSLIERLGGVRPATKKQAIAPEVPAKLDLARASLLSTKILELERLGPQERGFAFERFLKELFDLNGLAARASFRLIGEQIDGSFALANETYLLEAKWTGPMIGASDLRAFDGKVADKTAWSRGLFVSHSGFSAEGLVAFGRGKRVVCMDGLDLYDMLNMGVAFSEVMEKKVRRAAETGDVLVRVRDLFPR